MFATSKIARLACLVCLAALPVGNGALQPAGAKAAEIIRFAPVVRRPVVAARPAVPVVGVAPTVRVGPIYARPYYRTWYGYRGYGWYRWRR